MRKAQIAGVMTAVLIMVGVSAPAMASTAAHQRALASSAASFDQLSGLNGTFHVCTRLIDSYCIISNGTGLQAAINTSGYAALTLASIPGSPGTYTFTTSHGKCLRENGQHQVITQGTGCNTGDPDEQWVAHLDSDGYYFHNNGQDNLLTVDQIAPQAQVWGGTTNDDWHWYLCWNGACAE
jgi:hypothetical protein